MEGSASRAAEPSTADVEGRGTKKAHLENSGKPQENEGRIEGMARTGQKAVPKGNRGGRRGGSRPYGSGAGGERRQNGGRSTEGTEKERSVTAEFTFRMANAEGWEQKPGIIPRAAARKKRQLAVAKRRMKKNHEKSREPVQLHN